MDQRFPFSGIFQENNDGSLTPKRTIEVNGIRVSPGVIFQKGVSFGGVDFQLYKYWDIAAEEQEDGGLKITGFYKPA